jgi:methionine-rich copper-binding protein CopC
MNRLQAALLAFGLFTACPSFAEAHAFLDSAEPAVGSTVKGPPAVVKIWFTKEIETAGSSIAVFDAEGTEVDRKDDKLDPADPFLMTVSVPKLPVGTYRVVWNAICRDTHHTTGTFTFEVGGP